MLMPREYVYVQVDANMVVCGDLAYVRSARKRRISIDAVSNTRYSKLLGREGDNQWNMHNYIYNAAKF